MYRKYEIFTGISWLYAGKTSFFLVQYWYAFLFINLHAFRVHANPESFSMNFFVSFFVNKNMSLSLNNSWYILASTTVTTFCMENKKFLLTLGNLRFYSRKTSFFLVQNLYAFFSINLHAFTVYANPEGFFNKLLRWFLHKKADIFINFLHLIYFWLQPQ